MQFKPFLSIPWLTALVLSACAIDQPGETPPVGRLHYPTGLALSPDQSKLFVLSSDFDQRYNAGRIHEIDSARLLKLATQGSTQTVALFEDFQDAAGSIQGPGLRIEALSTDLLELAVGTGAEVSSLLTVSRLTGKLLRSQLSPALSCRGSGAGILTTDCTASHSVDLGLTDAMAMGSGVLGDDAIILVADGTPPLYRDPGLSLVALSAKAFEAKGEGELAVKPVTREGYSGASVVRALGAKDGAVLFLVVERNASSDPRAFVASAKPGADGAIALEFGPDLRLGQRGSIQEVIGATVDATRRRIYLSVRFSDASDASNAGIAVLEYTDTDLRLIHMLEVGDALSTPSLLESGGRKLLYVPDQRQNKIFVIDIQSDRPVVAAVIPGLQNADASGTRVRTLKTPYAIRFVPGEGGRLFGVVTNFANSTLSVIDASAADPREHGVIARFGRAINARGERE